MLHTTNIRMLQKHLKVATFKGSFESNTFIYALPSSPILVIYLHFLIPLHMYLLSMLVMTHSITKRVFFIKLIFTNAT